MQENIARAAGTLPEKYRVKPLLQRAGRVLRPRRGYCRPGSGTFEERLGFGVNFGDALQFFQPDGGGGVTRCTPVSPGRKSHTGQRLWPVRHGRTFKLADGKEARQKYLQPVFYLPERIFVPPGVVSQKSHFPA